MGAKNQALKNAARRRAAETGQSYEAALQDVRREYEQGAFTTDDQDPQDHMGFAEAVETEYRSPTYVTGYFFAWGAQELAGVDQLQQLVQHAEKHGQPGSQDPIVCFLCDQSIVVTKESEIHVGLALQEVQRPGTSRLTELQHPVWTHERCGRARVWSWSQITLERRRRKLPVNSADLPPKQHRRGHVPVEDYFAFTVTEDSPPLFYLQPGDAHRHGPMGFRADRLSDGLPGVDFTRDQGPRLLPEWSVAADRTGLLYIDRQGTGRWYQPPTPWAPPANWLAAAAYHQRIIFLTAPAGSVPTERLEGCTGDLSDLLAVGRGDMLFGAEMPVTGLA